jgi:hypothetical protein
MNIGDIFWIFLIYAMVVPWVRQKMLDMARVLPATNMASDHSSVTAAFEIRV